MKFGGRNIEGKKKFSSRMGLSNFHSPAEGVLPVLVMNTVLSVALFKNMVRSVFQVVGANSNRGDSSNFEDDPSLSSSEDNGKSSTRVLITRYGSLMWKKRFSRSMEDCCCVCLCRFKEEEEVSEFSYCHHFLHKGCLEKWFDNQHTTCPLCRSIL